MFAEVQQARDDAGAAADRVAVTRLVLTDFRNYRKVRLTVGTTPVVLTELNGAGKTNLLEALSFRRAGPRIAAGPSRPKSIVSRGLERG